MHKDTKTRHYKTKKVESSKPLKKQNEAPSPQSFRSWKRFHFICNNDVPESFEVEKLTSFLILIYKH